MTSDTALGSSLETHVSKGSLGGVTAGIWRYGKQLYRQSVGVSDLETSRAMQPDTIFRIASMTKPITSTVALMLLDEGRFELEDPITRFAPEFGRMRVLRSPLANLADSEPASKPITFYDLLTHRAGFTYGPFQREPLARAYADVLGADIDSHLAPDDWVSGLASLPLVRQPGTDFHYGHSTDLLGLLVARIDDAPLGDVFQRRLFGPLGMVDSGFTVPEHKSKRKAGLVGFSDAGELKPLATCPGGSALATRPPTVTFVSGGQGLWSTVGDYAHFAQMFIEGGSVDGLRVLKPETLKLMTKNHLTPEQRTRADVGGMPLFARGHGFGLGLAVVMEREECLPTICKGGVGTVGWPGGFGGWWQADPTNGVVMVFLCHNMVERDQFARGIGMSVYSAIAEFHADATRHLG